MANVITAPSPLPADLSKSIFLAESIDMNAAVDWQADLTQRMRDDDVVLLNPRRADWNPEWTQDISNAPFAEQVRWEMAALDRADVILMYFDPAGKAPITLLELGLHAKSGKLIVCCPEGYWRRGNVQVLCEDYGIPMVDDLDALIEAGRSKIELSGTSSIAVEIDNDILLAAALAAHKSNITLNQYIADAARAMLQKLDIKSD